MSRPSPNDWKNLIPGPTSNLCDKIAKILTGGPTLFFQLVSYLFNSGGTGLSDEFAADICALGCTGGSDSTNMPAPGGVEATDGTYTNKVRLSWEPVSVSGGIDAVTAYKVYRNAVGDNNPANATQIASVTAPTVQYDDTTVAPDVQYNYWVKATNGVQESAFSVPDTGYAGVLTGPGEVTEITDLRCTKGFNADTTGFVRLVFTPTSGATKFDVYRGTTDVFGDATKIASDITPAVVPSSLPSTPTGYKNRMINSLGVVQIEEWIYYDEPPSGTTVYYYWVVLKNSQGTESDESNSDTGWIQIGAGETLVGSTGTFSDGDTVVVPAGCTKMKVVLFSMGGGGAGAGSVLGGGGGGGGGVVLCDIPVAEADEVIFNVIDQSDTGGTLGVPAGNTNTPAGAQGGSGDGVTLELNDLVILSVNPGIGGQYHGETPFAPGGFGGAGYLSNGFSDPSFTARNGTQGSFGRSGAGGYGGWAFGFIQNSTSPVESAYNADESGGGGGTPNSNNPSLGIGGQRGRPSRGIYCFV